MSKTGSADTDADAQPSTTETTTTVDWAALWDEFGFDTENGVSAEHISKTQLRAALECTEQNSASGQSVIDAAVDDVVLVERRTENDVLLGYVHVGGGQ